jgi:hypothetical protein
MKHFSFLKIGALVLFACTACAAPPLSSPLQSPVDQAAQIPIPRPTQDATLGQVTGKLLLKVGSNADPLVGRILYLAALVKDDSGTETAAGLDRVRSPRTYSDVDGSFTFYNVPPGRYAIVLDVVRNAYMLRHPDRDEDLIVTVTTGGTADVGPLAYAQLPE